MSWKGPIVEVISTAICAAALGIRRRHCATREAHRRAGPRPWTGGRATRPLCLVRVKTSQVSTIQSMVKPSVGPLQDSNSWLSLVVVKPPS